MYLIEGLKLQAKILPGHIILHFKLISIILTDGSHLASVGTSI